MGELLELAARCEAATGPDAEIDKDVLEATGGCAHRETKYYFIEDGNDYDSGHTCLRCKKDTYGEKVPRFTASLDVAMTLVPEGARWTWDGGLNKAFVRHSAFASPHVGRSDAPALALCAAALRARAQQPTPSQDKPHG